MPNAKYDPTITPLLFESLLQNGLSLNEICRKVGVSRTIVRIWKKKYPDFKNALKRGKDPVDRNVVSALYRSAVGYEFREVVTEPKKLSLKEIEERSKMENPPPIPLVEKKVTTKYIPPNVIAQIFWLKNRLPEQWKDRTDTKVTGKIEYTIKLPPKPNEDIKVGSSTPENVIASSNDRKLYDATKQIPKEIITEVLGQDLIEEAKELKKEKAGKHDKIDPSKEL